MSSIYFKYENIAACLKIVKEKLSRGKMKKPAVDPF